jgi:ribulose-5-phosphate 4-epimerase/fuculose-1-phosphate aldolase
MLLRNHGTLTVGSSVGDAFQTMYFLERACAMQVATQSGNAEPLIPGSQVQDLVARQTVSFGDMADRLLWPALLRKLDRIDTGYRA